MSDTRVASLSTCCLAEALGTFLLVLFGCGAVHSAVLTDSLTGLWQVGIVWGLAITLAIFVVGPISGAHINPAMTIGFAFWGRFPMQRVMAYVSAQMAGAFAAAAVLFVLFQPWIAAKEDVKKVVRGAEGSEVTAMCFGEYFPNPGPLAKGDEPLDTERRSEHYGRVSHLAAFLAELLGTAILGLVVASVTHHGHPQPAGNITPAVIGLCVTALICVIAPLTQACFNPARDFGPRLFAAFAGWGSVALPGPNGIGFLTVYIVAPILGAIGGIGLHQRWIAPTIARNCEQLHGHARDPIAKTEHRRVKTTAR